MRIRFILALVLMMNPLVNSLAFDVLVDQLDRLNGEIVREDKFDLQRGLFSQEKRLQHVSTQIGNCLKSSRVNPHIDA